MRKIEAGKSEPVTSGSEDENGPQTKECRWPPGAGKGKKMDPPLEPPKSNSPVDTLIFTQ